MVMFGIVFIIGIIFSFFVNYLLYLFIVKNDVSKRNALIGTILFSVIHYVGVFLALYYTGVLYNLLPGWFE